MNRIALATVSIVIFSCTDKIADKHPVAAPEAEHPILGEWVLENDPTTKVVFNKDGTRDIYYQGEWDEYDRWNLTSSCNGHLSEIPDYIEITDASGFIECNAIMNLKGGKNGILSYVTDTGRLVVMIRPHEDHGR